MRIRVDESAGSTDGASIWPVYDAVFADHARYDSWRETVWDPHIARDGFRVVRAYQDEEVVGFAYGYTGAYGQWWTDNVSAVLDPELAEQWLGGHFELVSIGVAAAHRRQGIARGLLRALLEDLPHDRLLLMTSADPDDPARLLYASEGWSVLGPGTATDKVTMGRRAGDTGELS